MVIPIDRNARAVVGWDYGTNLKRLGIPGDKSIPDSTGLPFVVWVFPKAGAGHNARIKISHSCKIRCPEDLLSVAIRPSVRVIRNGHGPRLTEHEIDLLFRWVELNRAALIRHWNGGSDSMEVIEAVKEIED